MRSVASAAQCCCFCLGPSSTAPAASQQPPATSTEPATNPFGMSTSGEAASQYASFLPLLAQSGARSLRMFGEWGSMEPKEGSFDFAYEDRRVAAVRRAGLEPTGLLLYSHAGPARGTRPSRPSRSTARRIRSLRPNVNVRYRHSFAGGKSGLANAVHSTSILGRRYAKRWPPRTPRREGEPGRALGIGSPTSTSRTAARKRKLAEQRGAEHSTSSRVHPSTARRHRDRRRRSSSTVSNLRQCGGGPPTS